MAKSPRLEADSHETGIIESMTFLFLKKAIIKLVKRIFSFYVWISSKICQEILQWQFLCSGLPRNFCPLTPSLASPHIGEQNWFGHFSICFPFIKAPQVGLSDNDDRNDVGNPVLDCRLKTIVESTLDSNFYWICINKDKQNPNFSSINGFLIVTVVNFIL